MSRIRNFLYICKKELTVKDFLPPIINNLFSVRKEGGEYFYKIQKAKSAFEKIDLLEAYEIPEVNSTINLKARSFSNYKLKEVDKEGKEKQTKEGQALIKLLENPNWFQGGKEFAIQTKTMREIFGNEYLYKLMPMGLNLSTSLKGLFTIPANIVTCKYKSDIAYYLYDTPPETTYKVKIDEIKEQEIAGDLIIHFNDNRVEIKHATDKNMLTGQSKLGLLAPSINNLRMAYESRGVILQFRGANGAWVNKSKDAVGQSLPLKGKDKNRLQQAFKGYGTMLGQNQTIVTDADVAWVQAGTNNPKNLGLFEETREDHFKILDTFGVPLDLFAGVAGSTFENQKQAEKGLYIRTIIPEAQEWIGGISYDILGKERPTSIIADYMHLPLFQEDIKSRSESQKAAINVLSLLLQDKQITQAEYRQEMFKLGIGDGIEIPPPTNDNQADVETLAAQAQLRGSVGGVQGILNIQSSVAAGTTSQAAAIGILTIVYGFTDQQAREILA